jgi:hypothetical protein
MIIDHSKKIARTKARAFRKMKYFEVTRANTNPNDAEANAAGGSGNARALRESHRSKESSV